MTQITVSVRLASRARQFFDEILELLSFEQWWIFYLCPNRTEISSIIYTAYIGARHFANKKILWNWNFNIFFWNLDTFFSIEYTYKVLVNNTF